MYLSEKDGELSPFSLMFLLNSFFLQMFLPKGYYKFFVKD